ncbi:MAG: hypothetical protein QNJ97_18120 [Myxococcota bacterium]|nr:hypothetical protein [Myxococcota bacterium]
MKQQPPEIEVALDKADVRSKGLDFKKVLCWVNSTRIKDSVVALAKSLAATCNGKCHVVMGLDCPSRDRNQLPSNGPGQLPLTPEVIGRAETELAALYGEDAHTMVLPGHPIAEVRRYARTQAMDIIAVGDQGLAVERAYGERLCDNAPCAVVVLMMPQMNNPKQTRPQFSAGRTYER